MKTDEQYYIETYGLKSSRRKNRLKHWGRDKDLLKMENELFRLIKMNRETGLIELERPIQRGWKRFYVLRDDVAKSKDANFYQSILDKINTEVICSRKDFLYKDYKTKKLKPIEQHTKWFARNEFEELGFSEKQRELFENKWVCPDTESRRLRVFVYLNEWQFEFRTIKNIITHIPVYDSVLEAKIAELEKYVYSFENRNRLFNLRGKSANYFSQKRQNFKETEKLNSRWLQFYLEEELNDVNFKKRY